MHERARNIRVPGACGGPRGAVLFDMDGVLVANLALHRAAWEACLAERYGVALAPGDRRIHAGLNHEILARVLGRAPGAAEARAFHEAKEARYRELARGALAPVPGVRAYLAHLAARGVPVALVTGSDAVCVRFVLDELGLAGRFEVIVTGDDVPRGKPAPDPYALAIARLGAAPPEACLVHEDAEAGVASAVAAGAAVAAIATSVPAAALREAGACWAGPDFEAWLAVVAAAEEEEAR